MDLYGILVKKTMLKLLLEKCFIIDKDYKKLAPQLDEQKILLCKLAEQKYRFPDRESKRNIA